MSPKVAVELGISYGDAFDPYIPGTIIKGERGIQPRSRNIWIAGDSFGRQFCSLYE